MRWPAVAASGLGVGYARWAPGTFGSVLGVVIGCVLLDHGHLVLAAGVAVASVVGMIAIPRTGAAASDPGWIVIDEVAGQMVALLGLPFLTGSGVVLAFVLFRLFDIRKPWPISVADARADAWGIMGDDWIAGGFVALILVGLRYVWPGSGL
jgi:phosphatidylglycerophosphatase A